MNFLRNATVLLGLLVVFLVACGDDDPTVPPEPLPDTTAPTVLSVDPQQDDTGVAVDATILVVFNEDMDETSSAGNVALSAGTITNMTWTNTRTLSITHSAWGDGVNVTVTLSTGLKDEAGNGLASAYVWDFWIDTPLPEFLTSVPADMATGVNRNAQVSMLFSRQMNLTSLESATSVSDGSSGVRFSLSAGSGDWVLMTFDATLPATATITVSITTAAQDNGGNNLGTAASFGFTTGTAIDNTPPTLQSIVPANGSTISANTGSIVFTFDEPINPDTFDPSMLSAQLAVLLDAAGISPTWSPDGTQLTVPLPTPLPAGLPIAAQFDSFFDMSGNEQTTPINYRVDVAGTPNFWPFVDGARFEYEIDFTETQPGSGTSMGTFWDYIQMNGQGGNVFHLAEYDDETFSNTDGHDIYRVTGSAIELTGFYEDDAGTIDDVTLTPPVDWQRLPFAPGTWNGVSTAVTPEGNATITYSGETVTMEDVASILDAGGSTNVVWLDCWKVTRMWSIDAGGEIDSGNGTFWYAPGIGLVKSTEHEDSADGSTQDDTTNLISLPAP